MNDLMMVIFQFMALGVILTFTLGIIGEKDNEKRKIWIGFVAVALASFILTLVL